MYNPAKYGLTLEDIPAWMRPTYRGIDWSLLAVVVLCTALVMPLATRTGIPASPQTESEMYRIAEMAMLLESGDLYPRWAPSFNYGYGSPLFNHIAPLPHYAGGVYVALIQEEPHVALKALMVAAYYALGLSTFGFLRRRSGELAAMWGTAVMLMSPYLLMTMTSQATDIAQLWAMAAFMLTLWMLDRTLTIHRGRDLMALVLSAALLLLSHTTLGPLLFLLAFMWGALVVWFNGLRQWRLVALAFVLGVGVAAFYWLPAAVEQQHFRWEALNAYPVAYDTSTLLLSPPPTDRSAMNLPTSLYIGVATWLWGVVGAGWWLLRHTLLRRRFNRDGRQHSFGLFIVVGLAVYATLQTNSTGSSRFDAPDAVALTGVLVMVCALMAAQLGHLLEIVFASFGRRLLALSILVIILCFSAATSVYVPPFMNLDAPPTSIQHFNEELRGDIFGTMRNGYFLPASVRVLPPPLDQLSRDLQSLPPNTRVTIRNPVDVTYEIESAGQQSFTLLVFDYPGWQARLNDQVIDPEPDSQSGLIRVILQDGFNRLDLRFQDTPVRTIGWAISLIALLGSIVVTVLIERRSTKTDPYTMTLESLRVKREQQRLSMSIAVVLAAMLLASQLYPERFTRATPDDAIPEGVNALDVLVSGVRQNGVSLLGYQLVTTRVRVDDHVKLTLYWRSNGVRVDPYQINLLLLGDNDEVIQRTRYRHIAIWPTRRWTTNQYASGTFEIPVPQTPGTYRLALELGPCNQERLEPCESIILSDIYDLRGPIGQQIVLPQPIIVYN